MKISWYDKGWMICPKLESQRFLPKNKRRKHPKLVLTVSIRLSQFSVRVNRNHARIDLVWLISVFLAIQKICCGQFVSAKETLCVHLYVMTVSLLFFHSTTTWKISKKTPSHDAVFSSDLKQTKYEVLQFVPTSQSLCGYWNDYRKSFRTRAMTSQAPTVRASIMLSFSIWYGESVNTPRIQSSFQFYTVVNRA